MDLIEGIGIGINNVDEMYPSLELLSVRPSDPRAWELKTVEEYRLFRYSTSYRSHTFDDGGFEMLSFSVDFSDRLD